MAYSKNAPFRADVVGSYLRPDELKQARADYAAGTIDAAGLKAVEDRLITDLVAKQKAAGLHGIPSRLVAFRFHVGLQRRGPCFRRPSRCLP